MQKLVFLKLKYFFQLFVWMAFALSIGCSAELAGLSQKKVASLTAKQYLKKAKAKAENSSSHTKVTLASFLASFEKEEDFTCAEVADRYGFITSKDSFHIGKVPGYKDFFAPKLLDEAIVKNIWKTLDKNNIFFTQKEIKKLSSNRKTNLIEDLLINNCSWYDDFFKLHSQRVQKVKAWFDSKVLSGELNFALHNFFDKASVATIESLEKKLDKKWADITLDEAILSSHFSKDSLRHIKSSNQFEVFKMLHSRYNAIKDLFTKYPYKKYTKEVMLKEAVLDVKKTFLSIEDKGKNKYHTYLSVIIQSLDAHSHYQKLTKETRGNFLNNMGSAGLGVRIDCFKEACIVVKVFKKGASFGVLQAGDLILSANSVRKKEVSVQKFISSHLKGKKGSLVNLKITRLVDKKEQTLSLPVVRGLLQANRFESKLLNKKTAYIKLASFYSAANGFKSSSEDFISALSELDSQADSLIIDLQNNPGGSVPEVVNILTALLVTSKLATPNRAKDSWTCGEDLSADKSEVLAFHTGELVIKRKGEKPLYSMPIVTYLSVGEIEKPTFSFYCNREPYFNRKPIVVLINKNSASASEILSLGLQESGIALVLGGKHSFGKGSGQVLFNDDSLRLTTFLWGSFLGKSIQSKGVESDIVVDFSNKEKPLENRAEKEAPRALPVLGNLKLPWSGQFGEKVVAYYKSVQTWVKKELAIPLGQLSKRRQLEEIKRKEGEKEEEGKKAHLVNVEKSSTDSLIIKEAINVLEDWKVIVGIQKAPELTQQEVVPSEVPEKNWNNFSNFDEVLIDEDMDF